LADVAILSVTSLLGWAGAAVGAAGAAVGAAGAAVGAAASGAVVGTAAGAGAAGAAQLVSMTTTSSNAVRTTCFLFMVAPP
jgi:hypothetical protein